MGCFGSLKNVGCRRMSLAVISLSLALLFSAARFSPASADIAYGYILPDSAITYLEEWQIADMSSRVAHYARMEIFARYGATFYSDELQQYFNQQYWYTPVYDPGTFLEDMLNDYEKNNSMLLSDYEYNNGNYDPQGNYDYSEIYSYISSRQAEGSVYDVDPDSYIFYDSDIRYLSYDDIAPLTLQELCYARNEIFARRGRLFTSFELQNYFDQKNWYYGCILPEEFSMEDLNAYELTNASLLEEEEYRLSEDGYLLDQPGFSYNEVGSYREADPSAGQASDDEYIFRDSNTRYLTWDDISSLSLQTLCYARNEIYARRGYIFRSQELRDYFGSKSWYYGTIPAAQFSSSVFNEWEIENIELLKEQEYSLNPNGYQLY